ncbi:hypothetical protein GALL_472410 [mine drainage metagenome]|uniref:Uncharacterized protein n=1 Tax=mine drainage metagenome TaxID=410659 RepID=A0A1J5Q5E0_9ZZZZ
MHRLARCLKQLAHQRITPGIVHRSAPLLHLGQTVLQGLNQQYPAFRVVQQIILQIGVALHHPDVTQHLVQHACRAARAALLAQLVKPVPGGGTQQADDDLAVRKRGVVVRNFPDAFATVAGGSICGQQGVGQKKGVHGLGSGRQNGQLTPVRGTSRLGRRCYRSAALPLGPHGQTSGRLAPYKPGNSNQFTIRRPVSPAKSRVFRVTSVAPWAIAMEAIWPSTNAKVWPSCSR